MRPRLIEEGPLLDELLIAFADLGYDGASMRALCRRIGVSHNLIHQRYSSKDAAWYAAVDHAFALMAVELDREVVGEDPFDWVRQLMYRFVDVTVTRPALARIIHQESARPGPRYEYMLSRYIAPTQERARELIDLLQGQGLVRPGPVAQAFFFLNTWGVGAAAWSWALVGGDTAEPGMAARLAVDMIVDGMRA